MLSNTPQHPRQENRQRHRIMAVDHTIAGLAASHPRRALTLDTMVALIGRLDPPLTINQSSAVKAAYQRARLSPATTLNDLARELRQTGSSDSSRPAAY